MHNPVWVTVGSILVLAACGQTTAAAGTDAVMDAAQDAAPDVPQDVAEGLSDGCGGDACGADDVWDAAVDSQDTAAGDASGTDVWPADLAADTTASTIDCAAIATQLQDAIAALAQAHASCQHDADCTTVSVSTACQGSCGIGLNANFASQFATALAALDDKFCIQTNFAGQCGYATPKCIAPDPGCVNNQCVYKK